MTPATPLLRWRVRLKKIVLTNCAAVVVGVALLLLHSHWLVVTRTDRRPEAVAGFGAALVALGIWLAVRPAFRMGLRKAIGVITGQQMPTLGGNFLMSHSYHAWRESQRPKVRRDVIADRVVGVGLIATGTLLNGYSAPVARFLARILSI